MLVTNTKTKSTLYRTLETMGLLFTDDYYVRTTRPMLHDSMSFEAPVTNDDIYIPPESGFSDTIGGIVYNVCGKISFQGSVVIIHKCEHRDYNRDSIEVWIGDEHICQSDIRWISTEVYDYGVLPKRYDEYDDHGERTVATIRYYNGIFRRYSVTATKDGVYTHTATIDFNDPGACLVQNPYCCLFYYVDGVLQVPTPDMITKKTDKVYVYKIPYHRTLDAFWCWNMVSVFHATANTTFNLHSPEDHVVYPHIMIDDSDDYPITTKFYPSIRVDKDCIVRVFDDEALEVPYPEVSRILLYPEFLEVDDPYNTDNTYLNNLTECDAYILDNDDDNDILVKFREIAPYCYRLGEYFPKFTDEQSDFLMLDNSHWSEPYIEQTTITRSSGETEEVIRFLAPYESYRDVLFYNGWVYSDYEVVYLNSNNQEDHLGVPNYILHDLTLDMNKLLLLKFNTAEDTVINNIGEWIDKDNLVQLHYKLNKLYRNLLVLKGSVLDGIDGEEAVRVSTVPPTVTDDERLWFELLLNIEPFDFETNPVEKIITYGLDPNNIPDEIKKGVISIDLEPDGGPSDYNDMTMVYYNYEDRLQNSLVLQMLNPPEEESITYNEITVGELPEMPSANDIVLEDQEHTGETSSFDVYYTGDGEPVSSTYDPGDVYLNVPNEGSKFLKDDGTYIDMMDIALMSTEDKIDFVNGYITEGTDSEIEEIRELWTSYMESMDESQLDVLVYRVMLTDYFYNKYNNKGQLMEEVVPKEDAIKHNIKFIVSEYEPQNVDPETTWIDVPVVPIQDYIYDLVCYPMVETAAYHMPEGTHTKESGAHETGSLAFDYMPHGIESEAEIFRPVLDENPHTVHYDNAPETPVQGDVWYEFLSDVRNRICYSDETSMVININENLILIEFENDNITAFAFDDILMNFKGKLGIRYLSIVADLLNSGVIKKGQLNIFYHRLITGSDEFDTGLKRLYTGRSHVLVSADVDTTDLGIMYSTNIGRFHVDYDSEVVDNYMREWAWRHVIDYRKLGLSFIPDRMLLFVNGRAVPTTEFVDGMLNIDDTVLQIPGMLQLVNFDEVIDNIDIFYSLKDIPLSKLKQEAISCRTYDIPNVRMLSHTDRDYGKFQPIINHKYTKRGFYDVLLEEFVLNGKLLRNINYLKDHPEEYEDFRNDMLSFFHSISDKDYTDGENDFYTNKFQNRIVIPCIGNNQIYQIGKVN